MSRRDTVSNGQTTSLCTSSRRANGIATAFARWRHPRCKHRTPSCTNWRGCSGTGEQNTTRAVEAAGQEAVPWTKPQDLVIDKAAPLVGLQGLRPGIFLALLADGSVQTISQAIDPRILLGMFTIEGGEAIPLPGR